MNSNYKICYDESICGTYMIDTEVDPLALRVAPGTQHPVIYYMPTCSEFEAYGYVDGKGDWYYGEWLLDGRNPVGWCKAEYLTRIRG